MPCSEHPCWRGGTRQKICFREPQTRYEARPAAGPPPTSVRFLTFSSFLGIIGCDLSICGGRQGADAVGLHLDGMHLAECATPPTHPAWARRWEAAAFTASSWAFEIGVAGACHCDAQPSRNAPCPACWLAKSCTDTLDGTRRPRIAQRCMQANCTPAHARPLLHRNSRKLAALMKWQPCWHGVPQFSFLIDTQLLGC